MKILSLPLMLALTACTAGPINPEQVCDAALEGIWTSELQVQCQREVARTAWQAGQAAAQKYRELPRQ